jgi:site-specific DNA recombinase
MKTTYILGPDLEVTTVKRIFDLYANKGYSYKAIANILTQDGIPSYYKHKWGLTSIRTILKNEAYIGNLVWNQYEYGQKIRKKDESEWIRFENAHEAIISKDVFIIAKQRPSNKDS